MALTDNLISFWELEETSGTRLDSHSANHLTDNNTVLSATGKVGNAADFEKDNSQYLSRATNAELSVGDIDFSLGAWVKIETNPGAVDYPGIVGKDASGANKSYILGQDGDENGRFFLQVSSNGTDQTTIEATTFGVPSTATWIFVVAWHDSVNNTINIQVNDGAVDSTSYSSGIFENSADFEIGRGFAAYYLDGLVDQVGFWKRVLTSQERTDLYNSGNGLSYAAMGGGTAIPVFMHTYAQRRNH